MCARCAGRSRSALSPRSAGSSRRTSSRRFLAREVEKPPDDGRAALVLADHEVEVFRILAARRFLAHERREGENASDLPVPTRAGSLLTVAEAEGVPEAAACVLFHWLKGRYVGERLPPSN